MAGLVFKAPRASFGCLFALWCVFTAETREQGKVLILLKSDRWHYCSGSFSSYYSKCSTWSVRLVNLRVFSHRVGQDLSSFANNIMLMSLLFPTVVLLNSKETQAELGWTSYPPNGVSVLACISWFHIMFVLHVTPHLRGSTSQLMFVCFFITLYGEFCSPCRKQILKDRTSREKKQKDQKKMERLEFICFIPVCHSLKQSAT